MYALYQWETNYKKVVVWVENLNKFILPDTSLAMKQICRFPLHRYAKCQWIHRPPFALVAYCSLNAFFWQAFSKYTPYALFLIWQRHPSLSARSTWMGMAQVAIVKLDWHVREKMFHHFSRLMSVLYKDTKRLLRVAARSITFTYKTKKLK